MNLFRKNSAKFLAVVGLLSAVFFADFLFFLNGEFPPSIIHVRELLLLVALLLLVPFIKRLKYVGDKAVTTKLKGLSVAVASIYLAFVALKLLAIPFDRTLRLHSHVNSVLFSSVKSFFFGLFFSIFVAAIMIGVLLILRDLIYVKRRKNSARSFHLLLFFMGLQLIYANVKRGGLEFRGNLGALELIGDVILFVLILLMVINSLRNSWINYLNKRQKIHATFLGMPFLVGVFMFAFYISPEQTIREYSASTASFIESMALFLCIYSGMAFLSLLLHLPTAGMFDRKIREIESLQDLSRTLSSVLDVDKIASQITTKAAAIIGSDRLWLELSNGTSPDFKVISVGGAPAKDTSETVVETGTLNKWIVQNKDSVLINEVSKDPRSSKLANGRSRFGSILGVPLISQKGVLGILYASRYESFGYDEDDRELLQAFANQSAVAIENARLLEAVIAKERFEHELYVAHEAQSKLLPKQMPNLPGLEVDATSIAANEVGGDYYDFFTVEGNLAVAVGDVSGKGAKAAFYMAELKGIVESLANIYASPRELMIRANQTLFGNLERTSFISLIYAIIDVKKKVLTFSRAGHCPLLYCDRKTRSSRYFEPPGLGLGLEGGDKFVQKLKEQNISLHSGDVIVLYTDGVIEARDKQHKEFGLERLKNVVLENMHRTAAEIKEKVIDTVRQFVGRKSSHDDLTIVVVKVV